MHRVLYLVVVSFLGNCYYANAQDFTEYYTVQHPDEFHITKGTEVQILIEDEQDHDGAVRVLGHENSKTFERMLEMIRPSDR